MTNAPENMHKIYDISVGMEGLSKKSWRPFSFVRPCQYCPVEILFTVHLHHNAIEILHFRKYLTESHVTTHKVRKMRRCYQGSDG